MNTSQMSWNHYLPQNTWLNSLKPHTQMIAASTLCVFLSCHASMVSAPHAPLRFSGLSLILLGRWKLCCQLEMPGCTILFYTTHFENRMLAKIEQVLHLPTKICCIFEISSQFIPVPLVRVKLRAQCPTETVARDSVGISWTGGRPMDVKPIKWRLTGNSWAGSPTCKTFTHRSLSQGAFHRSSFPFNAVVPWCKITAYKDTNQQLPSNLVPCHPFTNKS